MLWPQWGDDQPGWILGYLWILWMDGLGSWGQYKPVKWIRYLTKAGGLSKFPIYRAWIAWTDLSPNVADEDLNHCSGAMGVPLVWDSVCLIYLTMFDHSKSNLACHTILPASKPWLRQRKLGSNTSVLRTNRILRLEMMKGGARLRLDLDEGWCEALHDITIHHIETWPWWRVVWDFTWHNNTSHSDLTLMKGGVRLYMKGGVRVHEGWRREVVTKGSGDEGKWRRREVVTKGSGDDGKWWRREVVTKGSGDDGKWWRREVVTMGSGDEGKWWRREVVTKGSGDDGKWTKGSGDDGKWWRREVVTEGSGDDGKWWRREVMMKGSGDEGKWWRREVVTKGSGAHWNGCMGFVLGRKLEHETLCFSL